MVIGHPWIHLSLSYWATYCMICCSYHVGRGHYHCPMSTSVLTIFLRLDGSFTLILSSWRCLLSSLSRVLFESLISSCSVMEQLYQWRTQETLVKCKVHFLNPFALCSCTYHKPAPMHPQTHVCAHMHTHTCLHTRVDKDSIYSHTTQCKEVVEWTLPVHLSLPASTIKVE